MGVERDATIKEIKKAYRRLSLSLHPDKNKEHNATAQFRSVSKAFEVLTGNESRPLFDYYLKHPKDYFKVSGQHYIQNMPKSDVRLVLLLVIGLISWLMHTLQMQRYNKIVKLLYNCTLNNLGSKNGGTKQTMDLHKRASDIYDEYIKECKLKGDKSAGKVKMIKDPEFAKIVDQMVREVQIEGGCRKPTTKDLFAVQLLYLPYYLYLWAVKYHRRYISTQPLPREDQEEMARNAVGGAVWEDFTEVEQEKLITLQIWKPDVLATWLNDKAVASEEKRNKLKKKFKRRGAAVMDDQDEDD